MYTTCHNYSRQLAIYSSTEHCGLLPHHLSVTNGAPIASFPLVRIITQALSYPLNGPGSHPIFRAIAGAHLCPDPNGRSLLSGCWIRLCFTVLYDTARNAAPPREKKSNLTPHRRWEAGVSALESDQSIGSFPPPLP